jgi:valyl-tRNA synthetase
VLGVLLRLLHPAMPFVTEYLWDEMGYGPPCSLIRTPWPAPSEVRDPEAARAELDWVVRLVGEVRAVRAEMNVAPSALAPVLLRDASAETLTRAQTWSEAIRRMARANEVGPLRGGLPPGSAQAVLDEATVVIPLAGLIDLEAERARLEKDRARALGEARKVASKLDHADFVRRAPPDVVEDSRERLAGFEQEAARLQAAIARIAPVPAE